MLDRGDFIKSMEYLMAVYPDMEKKLNNQTTQAVWYDLLEDLSGEDLFLAVKMHASTKQFSPKPAEIREMVLKAETSDLDWSLGWKYALRSIQRFGTYRESEALQWIAQHDPVAAEAIRRMGYKNLCEAEEQMTFRANFRQAYNNQVEKSKFHKQLPPKTRQQMLERRESAKIAALGTKGGDKDKMASMISVIGAGDTKGIE